MPEPITSLALKTDDGVELEAELALPDDAESGFVLCHPHPQFGGTMRSLVISALFEALPRSGIACLRFNFRGVEGSTGTFDSGDGERNDAIAAIEALSQHVDSSTPLVLAGWSFGADVALSVDHPELAAWFAIAPPLKFSHSMEDTARDARVKMIALAEHDEVRSPDDVLPIFDAWTNVTVEVIRGASHFFVGRTDRLVELGLGLANQLR
jgi:alpha/beta superfamily hydrolase